MIMGMCVWVCALLYEGHSSFIGVADRNEIIHSFSIENDVELLTILIHNNIALVYSD